MRGIKRIEFRPGTTTIIGERFLLNYTRPTR